MNVRNARNRRRTIARLAAVVVAGTTVGVVGAYAVAAEDKLSARSEIEQIAEWADREGLSGLSPASLSPIDD